MPSSNQTPEPVGFGDLDGGYSCTRQPVVLPRATTARRYARTHSRSQRRAPKTHLLRAERLLGWVLGGQCPRARTDVRVASCWPVIVFHLFYPSTYPFYGRAVSWSGEAAACLCQVSVSAMINASTTNKHGRRTAPLVPRASLSLKERDADRQGRVLELFTRGEEETRESGLTRMSRFCPALACQAPWGCCHLAMDGLQKFTKAELAWSKAGLRLIPSKA